MLEVQDASQAATPALTRADASYGPGNGDGAYLTFRRYGGDYFLANVWAGPAVGGRSIPMSRSEKERAKSASLGKPEVVTVLARR